MFIVKIDSKNRIHLPKELDLGVKKAILFQRNAAYLLVPIPDKITEIDVKIKTSKMRLRGEEKAMKESKKAHGIMVESGKKLA